MIEALMCLRGIQITTAFGLAVEVGDWTRRPGRHTMSDPRNKTQEPLIDAY